MVIEGDTKLSAAEEVGRGGAVPSDRAKKIQSSESASIFQCVTERNGFFQVGPKKVEHLDY